MRLRALGAVAAIGLPVVAGGKAPAKRARHPHRHHISHLRRHRHFTVAATAYSPCDGSGSSGTMADGHEVRFGAVANNFLRLGTILRTDHLVFGRRWWRVEDRIGSGSQLDFWTPRCGQMDAFGRRTIGFRVWR